MSAIAERTEKVDYLEEFMSDHELGPDSQVWLVDYCLPGYLPSADTYYLLPTHSESGAELSSAEVAEWFLDCALESFEWHYEMSHASDCADCAEFGPTSCLYESDLALIGSLRNGDIAHHLKVSECAGFALDYPNNTYGEVWECRKVTLRDIGATEPIAESVL